MLEFILNPVKNIKGAELMSMKPVDIRKSSFRIKFKGYDPSQVQSYLDAIANEMQELLQENSELKVRIKMLEDKLRDFQNMEEELKRALILAQKSAQNIIENAKKEASIILEKAKIDALAQTKEAVIQRDRLNEEIENLKKKRWEIIQSFKGELEYFLRIIEKEEKEAEHE